MTDQLNQNTDHSQRSMSDPSLGPSQSALDPQTNVLSNKNERFGKTVSINNGISSALRSFPKDMQDMYRYKKRVEEIYTQFKTVVPQELLPYINSVYLVKDKTNETAQDTPEPLRTQKITAPTPTPTGGSFKITYTLTVYVDNSVIAAELNARRELIVLKYKEEYGREISQFIIKTSRGKYRDQHPFTNEGELSSMVRSNDEQNSVSRETSIYDPYDDPKPALDLTDEEIEAMTNTISDPRLRKSFIDVLMAQKRDT